ncbi:hypothetical protein D8Y22_10890 [Salinadaptatus halalkaliphilus]|uniref:Halobacterial output domain-containing protein n=1 Tax=Salinadaptatus halalkaliphilus TaxID=2419781 RepID=A0A4S3TL41_9EURY|nr:HalOD1 output domain-containing protein [Salinadaptatus halalkaliphilus]THE64869.1 hypothetical protein D8Y22_10890 [Salinadaptatus halalkaliphilus]
MSGTAPTDRLTPVDEPTGRTVYRDDREGTYHTWCDDTDYEPASTALLTVVSSILEIDPIDLEPLSERVDPDALNALVGHWTESPTTPHGGSISFPFADCDVTVRSDGEIVIDPRRPRLG